MGILLLLALTVLLGATAASFMIGLSDDKVQNGPPTVKFDVEYHAGSGADNDTVTIKHASGQNVVAEHAYVRIDGAECVGGSDDPDGRLNLADDFDLPTPEMKAGMTVQIRPDTDFDGSEELCSGGGTLDLSDASVDVIWDDDSSGSTLLYHWPGP